MHRLKHRSATAAMRHQHATVKRDPEIAASMTDVIAGQN
jgi:hypothetical protein